MGEGEEVRLGAFLENAVGWRSVVAKFTNQFTAGSARSSFGVQIERETDAGRAVEEFVLKQDPLGDDASMVPGSVLSEGEWYKAMWATGRVLVPEPVAAEASGAVLGSPFVMMRRVPGLGDPASMFGPDYDAATRQMLAEQAFRCLGDIAAVDAGKLDLLAGEFADTSPETAWRRQLETWEVVHDRYSLGPLPMIRAALRVLRANPPPPIAAIHVVHGDFRLGNFLYSTAGVHSVLDWEMAHFGDPHEDLAWALKWNFRWADRTKIWGIVEDEPAVIAEWERASGLSFDRRALAWWTLFSHVKLSALCLKAGSAVATGESDRVNYVLNHWLNTPHEEAMIAQDIEKVRA